MVKIEIVNKDEVISKINDMKDKILEVAGQGVGKAAFFMQNEVKASIAGQRAEPTSVDTGRFLNSIDINAIGMNQASVFTDIEYAKYLEYGTSRINPRRHFTNSLTRNQTEIKNIINQELKSNI
jgi:hypothetical protein